MRKLKVMPPGEYKLNIKSLQVSEKTGRMKTTFVITEGKFKGRTLVDVQQIVPAQVKV